MIDHWPSGGRDTTQFPSLDIEIKPDYREHLNAFLKLKNIGWNDSESQEETAKLEVQPQRYRSYRKLYQNIGLIYQEDGLIAHSQLGQLFADFPRTVENKRDEVISMISETAIDILSRYQLKNPTEEQASDLPDDCDVLPCICIWKIMLECENKIHFEEMNRVVLRILKMEDIDSAIKKINAAREALISYSNKTEADLVTFLGVPVHTNQASARIAYWYSFAGWGGLLINQNADADGYRHLIPSTINKISTVLNNIPVFYKTNDIVQWTNYYLGKNKISKIKSSDPTSLYKRFLLDLDGAGLTMEPKLVARTIASLCTKPFLIFTGLSGSGKTKLAQAFSYWISDNIENQIINPKFNQGDEITAGRVLYKVLETNDLAATFMQIETGTKVTLPYELLDDWIAVIKENSFQNTIPAREIRTIVEKRTKFSPQLNSFESHLKAAAFQLLAKPIQKAGSSHQVCIVPVGADWTNREPLLGFPNALETGIYVKPDNGVLDLLISAKANPSKPYFLILDEMNLSHVERYFADFLSVMETKKEIPLHSNKTDMKAIDGTSVPNELGLSKNLFIIGTVNIDETTYMFSPKVLDRANVIEFRVEEEEMTSFLNSKSILKMESLVSIGANMANSFIEMALNENPLLELESNMDLNKTLLLFFKELKKAGAEFGYRSAAEIIRFAAIAKIIEPDWKMYDIIDAVIMQKLLPKLHGSRSKLTPILTTLAKFCITDGIDIFKSKDEEFRKAYFIDFDIISTDQKKQIIYPLSFKKISRMHKNAIDNGFTSYSEA